MKAHKMGWYREWHQWRLAHHFHVAMLIFYIASILLGSLAAFFPNGNVQASTSYEWNMSTPSEYTYDPAKLTFSSGVVQPAGAYSITDMFPWSISCPDVGTCYMVGQSGKIAKTTDGGANWSLQTSGTAVDLTAVSCPSTSVCYAVGSSGTIRKTVDGGATA